MKLNKYSEHIQVELRAVNQDHKNNFELLKCYSQLACKKLMLITLYLTVAPFIHMAGVLTLEAPIVTSTKFLLTITMHKSREVMRIKDMITSPNRNCQYL